MNRHPFDLIPFENGPTSDEFKINGAVERSNERLVMDYSLMGPLDRLLIPPQAEFPGRKNQLWKETCFECFIGTDHATRYWEINLSPAGHWNIYKFDAYRSGMKEAAGCSLQPSITESVADWFKIRCDVDLRTIDAAGMPIRTGVCAILKTTKSEILYWAIVHPGSKPDFHRMDGFALNL